MLQNRFSPSKSFFRRLLPVAALALLGAQALVAAPVPGMTPLPKQHPLAPKPYGATPTEPQVQWQRMEFYAFTHFGLNTFTGREWGYGDESESLFDPKEFNADEIVKTFKAGGMTGMIYTAKHHDGWCSWPTKTTEHSIRKSPWKNGKGDVVKEFAAACKKHGLKFGTYLSPWDRNHPEYGRDGYIKAYYGQIEELLTNYGDVFEIWFDGANGGDGYYGGARERRNTPGGADKYYNFEQIVKNIRKMQPNCIVWGASHYGDARWGGSEGGHVGYPHWHTVGTQNPEQTGSAHPATCKEKCRHVVSAHGIRGGDRWVPAEGDTPINRGGWFWHPGTPAKSPEQLMQVWFDCVGRGANLILNLAPDKSGKLDPKDVKALLEFKKLRDLLYKKDFARGGKAESRTVRKNLPAAFGPQFLTDGDPDTYWTTNDKTTAASAVVTLPQKATFDVVRVREEIRLGQRVDAWALDADVGGKWQEVVSGQTIGVQAMLVLPQPVTTQRVRLRITSAAACPCISELSLFKLPAGLNLKKAEAPLMTAGVPKTKWKIVSAPAGTNAKAAIDGKADTFWHTHMKQELRPPQSIVVDMGESLKLRAFTYLPRQDGTFAGMTDRYKFELSADGKSWRQVAEGEFGNLRANPIEQTIAFPPQNARYFRFTGTRALEKNHVSAAEIGVLEAK